MWYHTGDWSLSRKMSHKLIFAVSAQLNVLTAHAFAQMRRARAPGGIPTGKEAVHEFRCTAGVTAFSWLRHPFALHLKKMQPDFWPLGRRDGEGSKCWQLRDEKPSSS